MVKEIMTVGDLAEYLGFSKNWIYRKAEAGELPATRLGNRWRFKRSVIDRWLEESVLQGAKPPGRGRPARAKTKTAARRPKLEGRPAKGFSFIRASGEVLSSDYASKFKICPATARKDLNDLINKGLVRKVGGGRNTRYTAIR